MKIKILPVLLYSLISISACKWTLPHQCRENSAGNLGIILRSIGDDCYPGLNFPDNINQQWIIIRKSAWDSIWTDYKHVLTQPCDTPHVDFNSESVLAFHHGTGHGIKTVRNVTRDDTKKIITYNLTDFDCNTKKHRTMEFHVSFNMVVIPAIPSGYSVQFELKEGK